MLEVGETIPLEATVWLGPNERVSLAQGGERGAGLLLFYLFDWSAT